MFDLIKILVEKGISLNKTDKQGKTALHYALYYLRYTDIEEIWKKISLVDSDDYRNAEYYINLVKRYSEEKINSDIPNYLRKKGISVSYCTVVCKCKIREIDLSVILGFFFIYCSSS